MQDTMYILVISVYMTKWLEPFALRDHNAEIITTELVDEVICQHGAPRSMNVDQGRDFRSNCLKHVCELLEIEKNKNYCLPS